MITRGQYYLRLLNEGYKIECVQHLLNKNQDDPPTFFKGVEQCLVFLLHNLKNLN